MSQDQTPSPTPEKKWVGEPLSRVDGRLKVTGRAKYAGEFVFPNLAHAVLVQSSIAKGQITRIDDSAAQRAPGVLAVITFENMPKVAKPTVPPAGQSLPLLSDQILFAGQNVAMVVADTLEQAEYGAGLIKIVYSEEKPVVDLIGNLSAAFVPGASGRQPVSKRGDVDQGFNDGTVQVEQTYRTPTEHHNPMEPHATVAMWNDESHLTVYDSTQAVTNSAHAIASIFGLPPENVHLIDPFVGGGFGCKGQSWPHASLAALAAKVVQRPVKLEITRRQMFTSNGHRPETNQAQKLAARADGKLTAIHAEMANATSRLDTFLEPTGLDTALTYSCPNVLVRHQVVRLDQPAPTYMRAPGESSGSFSIESAMDELANELKIDPVELRLRNYAETDESQGRPFSSKSLKECYAEGAEAFGWSREIRG